jgi:hypothetical protein
LPKGDPRYVLNSLEFSSLGNRPIVNNGLSAFQPFAEISGFVEFLNDRYESIGHWQNDFAIGPEETDILSHDRINETQRAGSAVQPRGVSEV